MTTDVAPATQQLEQMRQALEHVEAEMLKGAGDGRVFHRLRERRQQMLSELQRLEMLERLEAERAERAHLQALRDRIAESRAAYGALRLDAEQLERELAALADHLEQELLPRCAAITREIHACAAREDNAISALKRAGETPGHPIIANPRIPAQEIAVRWWRLVHKLIAAGGFNPSKAAFQQTKKE
jgi:seryl-tRNA synthetase